MKLWPALLLLVAFRAPVYADVVITDPVVGPTTAVVDGTPVACDPALTINISTRFNDGQVNWSVYPSLPGANNYGPVWIAAVEDASVFCNFGGCTSGRFGWSNVGGPLDDRPSWASLDLDSDVGRPCVVNRTLSATTLRILTPPTLFGFLNEYFAGQHSLQDLFDFIAAMLR